MARLALVTTADALHIFISLPMAACCRLGSVAVFKTIEVAWTRPLPSDGLNPDTNMGLILSEEDVKAAFFTNCSLQRCRWQLDVKNLVTIHLARQLRRSADIKRFSGTGCGVGSAQ